MWENPRLFHALLYFMFTAFAFAPIAALDLDPVYYFLLSGLAFVFFVVGCAALWNWAAYRKAVNLRHYNDAVAHTPRLAELLAAANLSKEQAACVPYIDYQVRMSMVATEDNRTYFLDCPGGSIPLDFAEDFLQTSGATYLRAIRTYPNDSTAQEFARIFTQWLVDRGLATPFGEEKHTRGPHTAAWNGDQARARAARILGISLELTP